MTISSWRRAHLWLASISGLFLFFAASTGFILSLEPVYEAAMPLYREEADKLPLSEVLSHVTRQYDEVFSISRDAYGRVIADVIHQDESQKFYIDPSTAKKIGELHKTPPVFKFSRTLHRSLFWGNTGRVIIGIVSVILLIISISGVVLVFKKQGGFKGFFKKTVKNEWHRDYHTRLGKLLILTISLIAGTGGFLFLKRFDIIPVFRVSHDFSFETLESHDRQPVNTFAVFRDHSLSELEEIIFPFSPDVEEFFEVKLKDRSLLLHQQTGEIISEVNYPMIELVSKTTFMLHTGEGQEEWSIALGVSSLGILFFIYSGFVIFAKRRKPKTENPYSPDECEFIILTGSEHGSTYGFAGALHAQLLEKGQRSFLTDMDNLISYQQMTHLIIFTATYGAGEPPANARGFYKRLQQLEGDSRAFQYAVLGFGSKSYPHFCAFAYKVNEWLSFHPSAHELLPLETVNNQSIHTINNWARSLGDELNLDFESIESTKEPLVDFQVAGKTLSPNEADATFLLQLFAPNGKIKNYESGDLLAITPEGESQERLYSLAIEKDRRSLLLSVRIHPFGLCSNYLANLRPGEMITGRLKKNKQFHFPVNGKPVVMIANGTGIAPFLGMIDGNRKRMETTLFWGGQNSESLQLYQRCLDRAVAKRKLSRLFTAYSRVPKGHYVQDVIKLKSAVIVNTLSNDGTIMICGSRAMQKGVYEVLEEICTGQLGHPLAYYIDKGLLKEDCY